MMFKLVNTLFSLNVSKKKLDQVISEAPSKFARIWSDNVKPKLIKEALVT